jgi:outer membrane biosynthesis protein TonB
VSKKVFTVSVHTLGQRSTEFVPGRRGLVVGRDYDCDIVSEVAAQAGKGFVVLKKTRAGHLLRVPEKVKDATVSVDGKILSISALDEMGILKKKGGFFLVNIPEGKDCTATIGNITLDMGMRVFVGGIDVASAVPIDAALKRSWLSRDDYSFVTVLIVSALLHIAIVTILNRIEMKKPPPAEVIKQMAPRFARLILEPPARKQVRAVRASAASAPKKEAATDKILKKKTTKKKAIKKAAIKKPVRRSVRKRGLVGVIMAKSRPVVAIDTADDIIEDIDTSKTWQSSQAKSRDVITSVARSVGPSRVTSVDGSLRGSGSVGKNVGALVGQQREAGSSSRSNFGVEGGTGRGADSTISKSRARSRDEAEVYKRVRSYIGGLKYIYNGALRKNQNLKGNVTVRFVITPEGRVKEVSLVGTTLASEQVVDRILRKIYRWRFKELQSGEDFVITYTFDFSPVG